MDAFTTLKTAGSVGCLVPSEMNPLDALQCSVRTESIIVPGRSRLADQKTSRWEALVEDRRGGDVALHCTNCGIKILNGIALKKQLFSNRRKGENNFCILFCFFCFLSGYFPPSLMRYNWEIKIVYKDEQLNVFIYTCIVK